ncbi:MAG: hypothetical protein LUB58_03340 [Oscillospiraceae bacterium]|nr:hypothetical protein [Oscillospiraceae bacterium]
MGRASAAAKNRYNNAHYDRINLVVPKGCKATIKAAADASGESANAYIMQAVRERMARDQQQADGAPTPPQDTTD